MKILSTKIIYLFSFFFLFAEISFSQAPAIEWQNTIGGNGDDAAYTFEQTVDGGFILAGWSNSNISGDKTEPFYGGYWGDYWLVKLDGEGNIEWQNTIAGDTDDVATFIVETFDGGYFVAGFSDSDSSYDKTENAVGDGYYIGLDHHNRQDYWLVKTDSLGNIEWQNTIGGDGADFLYCARQTTDGGYILVGDSDSDISGDKNDDDGYIDYWVIKLDAVGNIQWQKSLGGNSSDWGRSIQQTTDGGYFVGGSSISPVSGDKSENSLGFVDYWVIKLDSLGNIMWDKTIGGSNDDYLYLPNSVLQTIDNGYLLAGYSYSGISGDKSETNMGLRDYWLVKLSEAGEIEWENTIGGNSEDILVSVELTIDGNYIIGGLSKSPASGDKTEENWGGGGLSGYDYWILKIDETGNIIWDKTIGGSNYDELGHIVETADGGYAMVGTSKSGLSGDKTEASKGGYDYWIVKLVSECSPIQEMCNGVDDDCDGDIDNGLTFNIYYYDSDGDGFGNVLIDTVWCMEIEGYILDSTDCDDINPEIYPGIAEICNGMDDNCNLLIDEGFPSYTYYLDDDDDGFGNILIPFNTCSDIPPAGYVEDNTDCDDLNNLIHEPIGFYADADGDLYGDFASIIFICSLTPPAGFVTDSTDCDDTDIFVNPVSNELCNGQDDNCNEIIDEGLSTHSLYLDADDDNYGDPLEDTVTCATGLVGYVSDSTDCDDTNPDIYPGAPELLNGYDDNCNKLIDEGLAIEDFANLQFMIYPVPATNQLTIVFNKISTGKIKIYNMTGEIILQNELFQSKQTTINISNLIPGNYLIRFMDTDSNAGSQLFTKLKSE